MATTRQASPAPKKASGGTKARPATKSARTGGGAKSPAKAPSRAKPAATKPRAAPAKAKATAKAKPAAKKQSVAESWAEGYRPLIEAVRACWAFLVDRLGFSAPTIATDPPSCLITFTRGSDWVRIQCEYAGAPWVVIKAGEGEPFNLDVIIAELDPGYAANKPVPAGSVLTPEEMRAIVAYQAAFVERHADEIFRGDPALLARFKARELALRAARS